MAGPARSLRVLVAVVVFDHLALDFEIGGFRLLRRQSLVISEISNDGSGVDRFKRHPVEHDHALDGLFPSLRRHPQEGDPPEAPLIVGLMTSSAVPTDRGVRDRKPLLLQTARRRLLTARAARAAALRARGRR